MCTDTSNEWVCSCPAGMSSRISASDPKTAIVTMSAQAFTLSAWVRASADNTTALRVTSFVQCRDKASVKPGFVLAFDRESNSAVYGVYKAAAFGANAGSHAENLEGLLKEDARSDAYAGSWVHYALVHKKADSEVSLYRNGELVETAEIDYPWDEGDKLDCFVLDKSELAYEPLRGNSSISESGNSASSDTGEVARFAGDVMQLYFWNGALNGDEIMYSRTTGHPRHASASISVATVLGGHCTDVDECSMGIHTCGSRSACTNTHGSFACEYTPDDEVVAAFEASQQCGGSNESSLCGAGNVDATCIDTAESYACRCAPGSIFNVTFTGSNTEASSPGPLGADGFAVALWVKVRDKDDRNARTLMECSHSVTNAIYFTLVMNASSNVVSYEPGSTTRTVETPAVNSDDDGKLSAWSHFAIVHNAGTKTVKIYKNGREVVSTGMAYPFKGRVLTRCRFGGSVRADLANFQGAMHGVYVWARPLNAHEVRAVAYVCTMVFLNKKREGAEDDITLVDISSVLMSPRTRVLLSPPSMCAIFHVCGNMLKFIVHDTGCWY
jgi:hypothetical protein